ncbi:polysaccharide biosynthesis tyrosine autokinase [Labilibaculum sp. DW002]|uniref:non-specific protein-tyrosine kinase n=1 Tax=Paralabilibaculum antarcticum TaxID=2912572 RepID=A0ABT5VQ29_9BACT|nr:tyrosine-protein kinase [Labilibaculum sp. DW002]MDE5417546.1 polysaccharide biosynthesis tyrosine autokinase [Labilibaculum sp. DW002]
MQNMNEMMEYFEMEEGTNVKEFIFRLLSKWHWFVLFGFLGLSGGYLISKYTQPTYKMTSTVLVHEESAGMGMDQLFEGFDMGSKTNIENHILMLKSYTLNRQALENMDRTISWFQKGNFTDVSLYKQSPYLIEEYSAENNLTGIALHVLPLGGNRYELEAVGEVVKHGVSQEVEFSQKGTYGQIFANEYFNFTLRKNEIFLGSNDRKFYFVFNDLNQLTKSYMNRLSVSLATKKADGINLNLEGNNPAREVDYMNELIRVYMNYGLAEKNRTSENTVRFIDEQLGQIVDSLSLAGQNFSDFRSKNGIVDLGQEAGLVVQKLEELESEKALAERRLDYFRNLKAYMGDAEQMKLMVSPSVVGIVDAGLNAQVVKLAEMYSRKSKLSFIAKEKNPSLLMVNNEITNTLASLDENLKNLLSNAEVELKSLSNRMDKINLELAGLPKTEQKLINIKRRFDLNNELYTFLLQKRAEAAITTASNVSDAQILDPARVDTAVKVGPKTVINLLVGLILGLALPFLVIVVGDYFNDTIKSKEDIEKESKLPIMGEIAHNNYYEELPIAKHPRSGIAESFRGLRTNLQYLFKQKDGCKVLAIHSMIPGEGKTFSSLNLASIIAMDNKKVLLVGCDLRKPRLHSIFEVDNKFGLSTYLIGNHTLKEIIQPTRTKNLHFVNSGPIPPNPAELLGTTAFGEFMAEAKKEFDYIVMDNAPVTLVTDGLLTGKHADANLFVLRQGYSNKNQIKFINQLAEKENISQLGIVLNDAVYNGYGYGYGKNYNSYGYGNGYYDEENSKKNWGQRLLRNFSKN